MPSTGLSPDAHLGGGRIDVAALDGGDIAEPERPAVHADQRIARRPFSSLNWPLGRTNTRSSGGGRERPRAATAFCALTRLRDLLRRDVQAR